VIGMRANGSHDVRYVQGARYHPLQEKAQQRYAGAGRSRSGYRWRRLEGPLSREEFDDSVDALAGLKIGEDKGPQAAHAPRVTVHHLEAGADQGREIGLVDDQEVGAGDAWAALARDLVARRDIDDVDRQIGELGREGGGEIVA